MRELPDRVDHSSRFFHVQGFRFPATLRRLCWFIAHWNFGALPSVIKFFIDIRCDLVGIISRGFVCKLCVAPGVCDSFLGCLWLASVFVDRILDRVVMRSTVMKESRKMAIPGFLLIEIR